jgi:hypothetical protein
MCEQTYYIYFALNHVGLVYLTTLIIFALIVEHCFDINTQILRVRWLDFFSYTCSSN